MVDGCVTYRKSGYYKSLYERARIGLQKEFFDSVEGFFSRYRMGYIGTQKESFLNIKKSKNVTDCLLKYYNNYTKRCEYKWIVLLQFIEFTILLIGK